MANGVWLVADVAGVADWFVEHRLPDGGWNRAWVECSTRSSFRSTLNSLKGLLVWKVATGGTDATRAARRSGEEYLLRRAPSPALDWRAGRAVGGPVRLPVPLALRRAQRGRLLREATAFDGTPPDPRMADAIGLFRAARQPDGTWRQGSALPGRVWFDVDVPEGEPSKWLTLIGTRVLGWWDAAG